MTVLYGDVIQPARVERILHLLCAFPLGEFSLLLYNVSLCHGAMSWCIGRACVFDSAIEGFVICERTREEVLINNQ